MHNIILNYNFVLKFALTSGNKRTLIRVINEKTN
jgi:hypothetical protein